MCKLHFVMIFLLSFQGVYWWCPIDCNNWEKLALTFFLLIKEKVAVNLFWDTFVLNIICPREIKIRGSNHFFWLSYLNTKARTLKHKHVYPWYNQIQEKDLPLSLLVVILVLIHYSLFLVPLSLSVLLSWVTLEEFMQLWTCTEIISNRLQISFGSVFAPPLLFVIFLMKVFCVYSVQSFSL